MERSYLEFEKPIEEIHEQITQTLEIGDKGQKCFLELPRTMSGS